MRAGARFETTAAELNRLRASEAVPERAPTSKKTRAQAKVIGESLGELEEELKARTLPVVPLAA